MPCTALTRLQSDAEGEGFTKADLDGWAARTGVAGWFKTSAKLNQGLSETMETLLKLMLASAPAPPPQETVRLQDSSAAPKGTRFPARRRRPRGLMRAFCRGRLVLSLLPVSRPGRRPKCIYCT